MGTLWSEYTLKTIESGQRAGIARAGLVEDFGGTCSDFGPEYDYKAVYDHGFSVHGMLAFT